ncbi:zinc finger protein 658-like [Cydia strobilella]|uniref:zinc finger protein 658-like n=1 Tax=Cydia strobilella TaxID=1100964 RepID=UPI0030068E6F
MEGSSGLSVLVRVKVEPAEPEAEPEHLPPGAPRAVHIKKEAQNGHYLDSLKEAECGRQEMECVYKIKDDPSCSGSECGVSEAAMLAGLDNHGVKDEVAQPELVPSQTASCSGSECGVSEAAMLAGLYTDHDVKGQVRSVLRECCLTLEHLPHVDTTHNDTESDTDNLYAREKELMCDLCGESFSLKSDLLKHVMDHIHRPSSAEQEGRGYSYEFAVHWTQEQERALCRKYAIRDCCVRLEHLQHHEALAGNDTQYITQTDTESDTKEVHTRVDYEKPTCDLCGESFALIADLKKHIMIHIHMPTTHHTQASPNRESDTEEKNIDIDCENEPTSRTKQLYENSEIHTYECDICGKIFKRKNSLKHHIKTHSTQSNSEDFKCNNIGEKSYCCETCGKRFLTRHMLHRHLIIHTDIRPFACDVCEKRFRNATHLKIHTRIHGDIRPYLCDVCKKRFRTTTDLKTHTRLHSGEKPYTCKICGKSFISNSRLNAHIRIHSGFRSYLCDVCKKQFRTATYLKIHTENYTDIIRPYWCDVCTKQFVTPCPLKTYTRVHSGEKPYTCKICTKRFTDQLSCRCQRQNGDVKRGESKSLLKL